MTHYAYFCLMNELDLKEFLDEKAAYYESVEFIQSDPIQLVHQFNRKEDIEIAGLLIATIAWGNRKSIIQSGEKMLALMHYSPVEFVLNYRDSPNENKAIHRTFNSTDFDFFIRALKHVYSSSSLEAWFDAAEGPNLMQRRISTFRQLFLQTPHEKRSEKHLSDPLTNSAAKRLNMYLRWMCRSSVNKVDFGIWTNISPSELYLPLDVHTANVARKLELLSRKQNDWKALEELMDKLRKMDPNDPVKYDFALFGLGAFEKF